MSFNNGKQFAFKKVATPTAVYSTQAPPNHLLSGGVNYSSAFSSIPASQQSHSFHQQLLQQYNYSDSSYPHITTLELPHTSQNYYGGVQQQQQQQQDTLLIEQQQQHHHHQVCENDTLPLLSGDDPELLLYALEQPDIIASTVAATNTTAAREYDSIVSTAVSASLVDSTPTSVPPQTSAVATVVAATKTTTTSNMQSNQAVASTSGASSPHDVFVKPSTSALARPASVKRMHHPPARGKHLVKDGKEYTMSSEDETDPTANAATTAAEESDDQSSEDAEATEKQQEAGEVEEVMSPVGASPSQTVQKRKSRGRNHHRHNKKGKKRKRHTSVSSSGSCSSSGGSPSSAGSAVENDEEEEQQQEQHEQRSSKRKERRHKKRKKSDHRREKRKHKSKQQQQQHSPSRSRSPSPLRSVSQARCDDDGSTTALVTGNTAETATRTRTVSDKSSASKTSVTPSKRIYATTPLRADGPPEKKQRGSTAATTTTAATVTHAAVARQSSTRDDANNSVYSSIMRQKLAEERNAALAKELDTSSTTTVTTTAKRSVRQTVSLKSSNDPMALQRHLTKELHGTRLALDTIKMLLRVYKGTAQGKLKSLAETIGYISFVQVDETNKTAATNIDVDTKSYLLHPFKTGFGYDFEDIQNNVKVKQQTLVHALWQQNCLDREHSLDIVFRRALREIADEMCNFDADAEITIANPVFIGARYLELRLLEKIRCYYYENFKKDIIRLIMALDVEDEQSELQELVQASSCRQYLKKLLDRYGISTSAESFTRLIDGTISTPREMRVWTDVWAQRTVNVRIKAHVEAAFEEATKLWSEMGEEERRTHKSHLVFLSVLRKRTKAFISSHGQFLSNVLRASELFCWMCFGLTTNDEEVGPLLLGQSYLLARQEMKPNATQMDEICWNYPLRILRQMDPPSKQADVLFEVTDDRQLCSRFAQNFDFLA